MGFGSFERRGTDPHPQDFSLSKKRPVLLTLSFFSLVFSNRPRKTSKTPRMLLTLRTLENPRKYRAALKGTNLGGQTPICGFLRVPAAFCGFLENLRFPAKICVSHKTKHLGNADSRRKPQIFEETAESRRNPQKTADWCLSP